MQNITMNSIEKHSPTKSSLVYEVNIFVYSLEPTKPDGEEGEDTEKDDQDSIPEVAVQLHQSLSLSKHSVPQPVRKSLFLHQRYKEIHQVLLLHSMWNALETCRQAT